LQEKITLLEEIRSFAAKKNKLEILEIMKLSC